MSAPTATSSRRLYRADPQLSPLQLAADVPVRRLAGAGRRSCAAVAPVGQLSRDTLYLPYATSLRMSDLGYQNNAQAGLMPRYNDLHSYMRRPARAVRQPYAPYDESAPGAMANGYSSIPTCCRFENEYYANIRPKRVILPGERPIEALWRAACSTSKYAAWTSTRSSRWDQP